MSGNSRVLIVVGGIAVCGLLFWLKPPRRTIADVAKSTTGCIQRRDADCVFDSILEDERQALNLTPKKIQVLLDSYVLPCYADRLGSPKVVATQNDSQGTAEYGEIWERPNHNKLIIATTAAATELGPRTICLTQWLIYNAIDAKYRVSPEEDKVRLYRIGLQRDSQTLIKLGFMGIDLFPVV